MHWADEIADKIIKSGSHVPYWVDDMKTPSGVIHVGSLRGVLIHDLVYKSLLSRGVEATYTYVFNDMDPMDKLPGYIDAKKYEQHLGEPFMNIPATHGGDESYAQEFAQQFVDVFNKLGCNPKILWSSQLYKSGQVNEAIKTALDHAAEIRSIYMEVAGQEKPSDWYPFQVICPKCGKVGSTQVDDWDGERVHFICLPDQVTWAKGCGYTDWISPLNGTGKLMWKVDWPAHWKSIGITIEGAGKDHTSDGGSRDVARAILAKVYNYPDPYDIPYEWFLIGGKKMSTSKGVGTAANDFAQILPPLVARFVFSRTHFNRQINFDPSGDTIPNLFDEYDRCAMAYWQKSDERMARSYELAQINIDLIPEPHFQARFRDVANLLQNSTKNLNEVFEQKKGEKLTTYELEQLNERAAYAQKWLDEYAPVETLVVISQEMSEGVNSLSEAQKAFLKQVRLLLNNEWDDATQLTQAMYEYSKQIELPAKQAFGAIYIALLGKQQGPKAGWLLLNNKQKALERLDEVINLAK